MYIRYSTVKDRYPESRVPSTIFIDFKTDLHLSSNNQLIPDTKLWSMLKIKIFIWGRCKCNEEITME